MKVKRPATDPKIAVGYIRASKDSQQLTPEVQRAALEAWATREGVRVASWHVDVNVCSVTPIEDRLGLCAAKRDRLARDPALTASIEHAAAKVGAEVLSAAGEGNGSTPADEFMRGIVDTASRYERALIRARTRDALKAKSAKGQRVGSIPFGFHVKQDGIHLEPDPAEQAAISEARALTQRGLSLRATAISLASSGFLSRQGRPFQATQIMRMLES
jgi:DNA invertase Pin-like site-specific DNA recombinase